MYALVMKYFILFCLLLFLATMLNLDWIKFIIDEQYWSGLAVVPILLLANLCLGVVYNLSIWYKLSSNTRYGAVIALVGAAVTITINIVFVPVYSYMASAWATLAAYGSMMLMSYFLGQKYFPIRYNLRAISTYSLVVILIYLFSKIYAEAAPFAIRIALNNLLIAGFVFMIYKLEIRTIQKLGAP